MGSNMLIAYNASNATNVTATTMGRKEQEAGSQSLVITYQAELKVELNQVENSGVFKATSGNAAKWWKMKQRKRATTRAGKLAEAVIKQIATQKHQNKKEKMREQKQIII